MRRLSFSYHEILNLVLPLLFAFWLHGAIKQAEHRRCFVVEESEREAFGPKDWIMTGWDWPIHWVKGTPADPIPCKPRGSGFYSGSPGDADIPKDNTPAGAVLRVLHGKDLQIAPGGLTRSIHGSDPSISAAGHRNLDRYLGEHSGNQANAQPAGADQGLSPEARERLLQRLKKDTIDQ